MCSLKLHIGFEGGGWSGQEAGGGGEVYSEYLITTA